MDLQKKIIGFISLFLFSLERYRKLHLHYQKTSTKLPVSDSRWLCLNIKGNILLTFSQYLQCSWIIAQIVNLAQCRATEKQTTILTLVCSDALKEHDYNRHFSLLGCSFLSYIFSHLSKILQLVLSDLMMTSVRQCYS